MSEPKNKTVLRKYQKRWANDPARFALAVKSAQIGYSTATAAWAVERCLRVPKRNVIFLSRSERQALELGQKAKDWVDGYQGVAAEFFPNLQFQETESLQHEIRFGNGSRIIVLAANPDTARGYTGDVVLDEFAFHKDSQAIFTAVYRQVSLGFSMRILSTPNGQRGKFWELAKSLGLDSGVRPARQPVRFTASGERVIGPSNDLKGGSPRDAVFQSPDRKSPDHPIKLNPWSGHWCDIFMSIEDGVPLDPDEVRAGCDEDTWMQEYCCQFISQASDWISPELFQLCVSSDATMSSAALGIEGRDSRLRGNDSGRVFYAGWDIARNRDLSVIWISELVGDVTWTRAVIEMRNTSTPDQIREARALMPVVRRMDIDKTGMGLVIFETLEREFPGQIEGVQFTMQSKEAMATTAKKRMEDHLVRLPDDANVRASFRSVKKLTTQTGNVRFDADHDAKFGHADHWWAFCMAEAAANQPVYHLAECGAKVGRPIVDKNWLGGLSSGYAN